VVFNRVSVVCSFCHKLIDLLQARAGVLESVLADQLSKLFQKTTFLASTFGKRKLESGDAREIRGITMAVRGGYWYL